jgi:uncharacterized membrane protein
MSVFGQTFKMLGASWHVLKKDMEILLFFFLNLACKLALAYFAYKNFMLLYPEGVESLRKDIQGERHDFLIASGAMIVAYHFINQFFNAAIVGSAARRLTGKNPNLFTGIFDALKRLPSLLIWAIIYSAMMTFTGWIKRKGKTQKAIGTAVQAAFHVASFFTLPLIMVENANPFSAMGRSTQLLGKSWGQQVVANISLFGFRFLMSAPGLALIAFGEKVFPAGTNRMIPVWVGSFLVILASGIVQTLTEIYRTALYLYVRDQKAPQGFAQDQLQNTFRAG